MWDRDAAATAAHEWVARYVHAWATNDADDIRALFTPEAEYCDGPSTPPWVGQDAIVAGWMGQKDDPDTWSFEYELIAVDGDVAVIRGWTSYSTASGKSSRYNNLMVIRLTPDGRAHSFTDWWVAPDTTDPDL